MRRIGLDEGSDRGRRDGQPAAEQRFHDHDGQAARSGVTEPHRSGLVFGVIVLDLGQGPLIVGVHELGEKSGAVVVGESQGSDPTVPDRRLGPFQDAGLQNSFPARVAEGVEEIAVDVLDAQPAHLLGQIFVEILSALDHPDG